MKREDEVRQIAYRFWEEAGCPEGCDVEHWLRAEREYDCNGHTDGGDAEARQAASDQGEAGLPVRA